MTYSSTLALGRTRLSSRHQNAVHFKTSEKTLGPISNTVVLIVLACFLGLLYLTQATKTNAFGYQINALEQRQTGLKQEHDELEVTAARLQSLEKVKNSEVAKSLVAVSPRATLQN